MRSKRLIAVIIAVLVMTMITACTDSENRFDGGELLDEEKLSEIRSSVFYEEKAEISTETPINETEFESETETESESETETEAETEASTERPIESELQTEDEETVYWTENGSVWHNSEGCRYIKNSNVICGTVDDAIEAGMERACSACGK